MRTFKRIIQVHNNNIADKPVTSAKNKSPLCKESVEYIRAPGRSAGELQQVNKNNRPIRICPSHFYKFEFSPTTYHESSPIGFCINIVLRPLFRGLTPPDLQLSTAEFPFSKGYVGHFELDICFFHSSTFCEQTQPQIDSLLALAGRKPSCLNGLCKALC